MTREADVDISKFKTATRDLPLGHRLRALAEGLPDHLPAAEFEALTGVVRRMTLGQEE